MIKPPPPQKRGIAAMLLLFCVVALVAGVGFEFIDGASARFSVIAQPGGRAILGVLVACVLVLLAHVMRALLASRKDGGGDASDHA